MKTLICIPCLNEEAHLETLVRKLVENNESLEAHIVIADGGSADRTVTIAKELDEEFENVTYLHNPARIQSAAINLTVKEYGQNADILIRIDAHSDYPDDYCAVLIEEAEKTGADSIVTAVETIGKTLFQCAVAAAQNSKLGNGGSAHRTADGQGMWIDHGHHGLMRIQAFSDVGGYDETFTHNEDAELDTRLRAAGYKIWLTGKTSPTYYPRSTPGGLFRQYFNYGRGRARTILKHRERPHMRQMIPVGVAPAVLLFLLPIAQPLASFPFLLWSGTCLAYGGYLAYKAKDLDIAWSGPAAMIMHFAWSLGFWRALFDYGLAEIKKRKSNE
ncbi:MAG: glycosyltransferase family 2 protein [Alphaproteobacteria bacterium]|nr:glycosyltransferase family 2 protein [Alphaproteobacteria bacterium]